MKAQVKRLALVGLSVLVAGSIIGATVYAQAPKDDGWAARGMSGRRGPGGDRIEALAEKLDVSAEELQEMLDEGLTPEEIAEQLGVDLPVRPEPGRPKRRAAAHVEHLDVIAEALGMTEDDLSAELDAGKTLEEIAEEQGVERDDVHEALQQVAEDAMRDRIAQAVEDETITEEHAEWLLEGLDKGFLMKRTGLDARGGQPMGPMGGMRGRGAARLEKGAPFPSPAEVGADSAS